MKCSNCIKTIAYIFTMFVIFIALSIFMNKPVQASERIGNYERDGEYITKVLPNTKANDFISGLFITESVEVKTDSGAVVDSEEIISTGMKVKIGDKTYDIAVVGDINKDGKIDLRDVIAINLHCAMLRPLNGVYIKAADINGNKAVNMLDVISANLVSARLKNINDYVKLPEVEGEKIYATLYTDGTLGLSSTNETIEGKTVSKSYGDISEVSILNFTDVPWYHERDSIINVEVIDEISPKNTAFWFDEMVNLENVNLSNLDTSEVINMTGMFSDCKKLTNLDISCLDTSNVIYMNSMFDGCESLINLDLSNFNTSNVIYMSAMFNRCNSLTSIDISSFDTSNVIMMDSMFNGCENLTSLDLANFDTSNVTDLGGMFNFCSSLVSLDLSNFNTNNVTSMDGMFAECTSLQNLNVSNFNTNNVTNMVIMFSGCENLTGLDLTSFDTTSVTNMDSMFEGCSALTEILVGDNWTTANASTTDMFTNCGTDHVTNRLQEVEGEKIYATFYDDGTLGLCSTTATISGKTVSQTFGNIINIDTSDFYNVPWRSCDIRVVEIVDEIVPETTSNWFRSLNVEEIKNIQNLNTSKVTDMSNMFNACLCLTTLDLSYLDTSKVTNMSHMFDGCNNLQNINFNGREMVGLNASIVYFDTSNVEDMSYMFYNCSSLNSLDLTNFNTENTRNMDSMFEYCTNLAEILVGDFWITTQATTANIISYSGTNGITNVNSLTPVYVTFYNDGTLGLCSTNEKISGKQVIVSYGDISNMEANDMGDIPWQSQNITNIQIVDRIVPKSTAYWFSGLHSLETIENLEKLDTRKVTNMSYMFYYCNNLTDLNVTRFNTSNVTDMSVMFGHCDSLTTLNLTSFNTANVTNMRDMFAKAENLQEILVGDGWITEQANTGGMFVAAGTNHVTPVRNSSSGFTSILRNTLLLNTTKRPERV